MFRIVALILIIVLGLTAISALLKFVLFPVHTFNNLANTAYDANSKVINADNAIYNYEWFKQKKADIDATKRQLTNARKNYDTYLSLAGEKSSWTFEDKNEIARLNSVVLGLENNLENQIGDYNARASMATRNIFEDNVLPTYIDALTFIRQ